jgi:hypothetical protein
MQLATADVFVAKNPTKKITNSSCPSLPSCGLRIILLVPSLFFAKKLNSQKGLEYLQVLLEWGVNFRKSHNLSSLPSRLLKCELAIPDC